MALTADARAPARTVGLVSDPRAHIQPARGRVRDAAAGPTVASALAATTPLVSAAELEPPREVRALETASCALQYRLQLAEAIRLSRRLGPRFRQLVVPPERAAGARSAVRTSASTSSGWASLPRRAGPSGRASSGAPTTTSTSRARSRAAAPCRAVGASGRRRPWPPRAARVSTAVGRAGFEPPPPGLRSVSADRLVPTVDRPVVPDVHRRDGALEWTTGPSAEHGNGVGD